ncbi:hypothetical protein SDRG_08542 [Saprolegnia diclina VS20]|uniref:FYVE-type domain-containing protein n=1 Tax=Saprolegnia diclina (strain VS20) TaxID=1156394 RepID=T0QGI9_SAPDV|nr:hypothetical protein SDRG_08542 [Saprolegnia diclina VS20]EQC33861.1 hypothetical protein SDRG_08542 [Saprolegnia diclina VS20]|eukprot:XP_008612656.1 hypothetical protein SDRG_08542 [Saprolegnia diclina VS20]
MPKKAHYPVPTGFFRCPALPEAETTHYIELGEKVLRKFLKKALLPDASVHWRPNGEADGVELFAGEPTHPSAHTKGVIQYRAKARIHASLEEVAALHAFESRKHCYEYTQLYNHDILDMLTLYNCLPRSDDRPLKQVYVKWTAMQSPVPFIHDRDFCFVEAQDAFSLTGGLKGWAFCQHSIALPWCPPLHDTQLRLVRGSIYHTGCVFLETSTPGILDVIYQLATDFKGSIPSYARKLALRRRARKITVINDFVHARRLMHVPMKSRDELVSTTDRRLCYLCDKAFFGLAKRHNCHGCGEVVCARCSRSWRLSHGNVSTKVRICAKCSADVRSGAVASSSRRLSRSASSLSGTMDPHESDVVDPILLLTQYGEPTRVESKGSVDLGYLEVYDRHKPAPDEAKTRLMLEPPAAMLEEKGSDSAEFEDFLNLMAKINVKQQKSARLARYSARGPAAP